VHRVLAGLAVAFGVVIPLISHSAASAYDGKSAAQYANAHVYDYNLNYYHFQDDCTNFVSQAMLAGGHKFHGTPQPLVRDDDAQWWVYGNGAGRTYSWSVADDLATFVNLHDGHTASASQWNGEQSDSLPGFTKGDPVFYDWSDHFNHAAIIVAHGTDATSGFTGKLVDEHTSDRKKVIWNLRPYNSHWAVTDTEEFHMSAGD
jgi:hypothetical protein